MEEQKYCRDKFCNRSGYIKVCYFCGKCNHHNSLKYIKLDGDTDEGFILLTCKQCDKNFDKEIIFN